MPDNNPDSPASDSRNSHDRAPRLLVLGANGPTGRAVVQQSLARGHHVTALTRHPEAFPIRHDHLRVLAGDATDRSVIDAAVADVKAVICTIGAAFTRQPVDVYSASAWLLADAMPRHGVQRLIVVTSAGVGAAAEPTGAIAGIFRRLMRNHIGRTVYDDMVTMEAVVSATDLDWTIVRPPGLVSLPGAGYAVAENTIDGQICAREDLAAMLLDQVNDDRFVRTIAAVTTPGLTVSARHMIWHEMLKR